MDPEADRVGGGKMFHLPGERPGILLGPRRKERCGARSSYACGNRATSSMYFTSPACSSASARNQGVAASHAAPVTGLRCQSIRSPKSAAHFPNTDSALHRAIGAVAQGYRDRIRNARGQRRGRARWDLELSRYVHSSASAATLGIRRLPDVCRQAHAALQLPADSESVRAAELASSLRGVTQAHRSAPPGSAPALYRGTAGPRFVDASFHTMANQYGDLVLIENGLDAFRAPVPRVLAADDSSRSRTNGPDGAAHHASAGVSNRPCDDSARPVE